MVKHILVMCDIFAASDLHHCTEYGRKCQIAIFSVNIDI